MKWQKFPFGTIDATINLRIAQLEDILLWPHKRLLGATDFFAPLHQESFLS